MTIDEAKDVYGRLFTAFPQVREWLAKVDNPTATYGVWCGVLAGIDYADAIAVVDRMILGDERMPEAYERERTPQMIRSAAAEIRSLRKERERMTGLHVAANEARTVDEKFIAAIRESRRIGLFVRDGKLKERTNAICLDELVEWSERGGQLPAWIGKDATEIEES